MAENSAPKTQKRALAETLQYAVTLKSVEASVLIPIMRNYLIFTTKALFGLWGKFS
jgi:hypothetical protein